MHKLSIYCIFLFLLPFFSIFTGNSLSAQGHSGIRCGTFHDNSSRKHSDEIHAVRPVLEAVAYFADSTICVHYDVSGSNAPSLQDDNNNGIPDYVENVGKWAEYSTRFFIDTLSFAPIPNDDFGGGTRGYDIYVLEQGPSGVYGATYKERQISAIGGQQGRYTTYIEIDNNYAADDSTGFGNLRRPSWFTTGEDALKVTVAHELHHAVQIGAYGNCPSQCTYHEMTSTWIEQRLFPDVVDWEQHIPSVMRSPQSMNLANVSDCVTGYRTGLFNAYLIDTQQDTLFLRLWDRVLEHRELPFAALKAVLAPHTTLGELMCEFYPELYFTGKNSYLNRYWPRATSYPAVELATDVVFEGAAHSDEYSVPSLGVQFHRYIVPSEMAQTTDDTLILVVSSLEQSVTGQVSDGRYHLFCGSDFAGDQEFTIGNTNVKVVLSELNGEVCVTPIERFGDSFTTKSTAFPQPFSHSKHDVLHLPVGGEQAGMNVTYSLSNGALETVLTGETSSAVVEQQLVVSLSLPQDIPAGVYIWQTTSAKGVTEVGKIVVRP